MKYKNIEDLPKITKKDDVLELNISFRMYNILCKMNIKTVNDIIGKNIMDFMQEYGCGKKSINELITVWHLMGHDINKQGVFEW